MSCFPLLYHPNRLPEHFSSNMMQKIVLSDDTECVFADILPFFPILNEDMLVFFPTEISPRTTSPPLIPACLTISPAFENCESTGHNVSVCSYHFTISTSNLCTSISKVLHVSLIFFQLSPREQDQYSSQRCILLWTNLSAVSTKSGEDEELKIPRLNRSGWKSKAGFSLDFRRQKSQEYAYRAGSIKEKHTHTLIVCWTGTNTYVHAHTLIRGRLSSITAYCSSP